MAASQRGAAIVVMSTTDRHLRPGSQAEQLYERALRVMPGGNTRTPLYHPPHPAFAERGEGCWIVDADGDRRLDLVNNYTSLIHGHADPEVAEGVMAALRDGTCFSMPTRHDVALAELLAERVPSLERLRFVNSGTEAVMMAIKAARAFTGRPKVAKCEGCYHGSYDQAEVSTSSPRDTWQLSDPPPVPVSVGTPQAVLDNAVILRLNDVALLERQMSRHGREMAALILDLMPLRSGLIEAMPGFVRRARELTAEYGVVLIMDEVISFRLAPGGAQALWEVTPDLTTLGKIIGGGFPVGAFGGREEIMRAFDPRRGEARVPHGGTFNANPVSMIAGLIAMRRLTPGAYARLDVLGDRTRAGLRAALQDAGVPGQVTGRGSLFSVHLHDRPLHDFRDAADDAVTATLRERIYRELQSRGVEIMPALSGSLSTPMAEPEVDLLVESFRDALRVAVRAA